MALNVVFHFITCERPLGNSACLLRYSHHPHPKFEFLKGRNKLPIIHFRAERDFSLFFIDQDLGEGSRQRKEKCRDLTM